MSTPMAIRDAICKRADGLVKSLNILSEGLPNNEIFQLRDKLLNCISCISHDIDDAFNKPRRVDQIRSLILASTYLDECKDYLKLIEILNFADTKDLVKEVDEMNRLVTVNSKQFN